MRLHEKCGTIENTQLIAAHESPRTTLYEGRNDAVALDEIERVVY